MGAEIAGRNLNKLQIAGWLVHHQFKEEEDGRIILASSSLIAPTGEVLYGVAGKYETYIGDSRSRFHQDVERQQVQKMEKGLEVEKLRWVAKCVEKAKARHGLEAAMETMKSPPAKYFKYMSEEAASIPPPPTPTEEMMAMMKGMFKPMPIPPPKSSAKFVVDWSAIERYLSAPEIEVLKLLTDKAAGSRAAAATVPGGMGSTTEGSLGDTREILSMRAMELATALSKVLRQSPQAFQELKQGGTLAESTTLVIAGQRISVTVQLDGLGEEKGIVG